MEPIFYLLAAFFFAVLPLILLARISHWAHATQARLEDTNKLLVILLNRTGQAGPLTSPQSPPRSPF